MGDTRIGLCIDPVGTGQEVGRLCRLLNQMKIRATVTPPGRVGQQTVSTLDHMRPFLEADHEIVNHTLSHPVRIGFLSREDQEKEIRLQHQRLLELGQEIGKSISLKGFRAPFYAYDEGIFDLLRTLGYAWDSSALYSPLLGIPFTPFFRQGLVEIPVLFPDDMTLLDRMLQPPETMFEVWWRSYKQSGRYFVFTIHPYGSAQTESILRALEAFLSRLAESGGRFLTLSEMADEIVRTEIA
jgi:peptidoglycan/xylan/chitin deacetylase (PgdA/CDA1 family)